MEEIADMSLNGAKKYTGRELFLFAELLSKLLEEVDTEAK